MCQLDGHGNMVIAFSFKMMGELLWSGIWVFVDSYNLKYV
jgi:hypothetical protein